MSDRDRTLANPATHFVDEKLLAIKHRRRELEARREKLGLAAERDVNLEAATEAALAHLKRFRQVLDCGTFGEQKEFLGAFVTGITLHPYEKRGVLHMRDMVAASICISGWTPDDHKKTSRPLEWTLTFRHDHDARAWKEAA